MVGIFDLRKDRDAEPHLKAIHSCHEGEILAMAFNPANGLVYTAGNELIIRAWDETKVAAREREWRPAAELHGHEDSIACLCVGGEPESGSALLFSGSDNGEVVMWDTVEHVEVARFTVDKGRDQAVLLKRGYSPEAIRQLITVPSAQLLVAVVTDGTLLLWDIPSRTLRRHFRQNHVEIRCVAHRPAAAQLLLGTEEGSIEVFPLSSLCSHGEDLRLPLPEPKPEPEPEPGSSDEDSD
jgi:WD40 repeat protein